MTHDAPWLAEALGQSDAFLACMEAVAQAAAIDRPALIVGERGTGKELAAARLHYHSPRWDRPYVPVNLAALPRALIESELFGHEAGAFTGAARRRAGRFEAADGGTLFLDELHAAPLAVQAKLLRAVEYGHIERIGSSQPVAVDARIVAAVNVDPRWLVARGRLLPDLLDRLAFCVLVMPPLRERHGDIPYLAERFAARFAAQLGRPEPPAFSRAALATLAAHPWPGNIRELKTVVERTVLVCPTPLIDTITLDPFAALSPAREVQEGVTPSWPPEASSVSSTPSPHSGGSGGMIPPDGSRAAPWPPEASSFPPPSSPLPNFTEAVASLEITLLGRALARSGGNQRRAAGLLGLGYHQFRGLYRKYAGALDAASKAPQPQAMRQITESDSRIRADRLPNGVRIVTEHMPVSKTASLGIWIEAGSRHEAPGQEGMAHLMEHMAFKGTAKRDALTIAKELDTLGGLSNAFTSREATCFHVRVMDAHLARAFDILSDIVLRPLLDPEELAREQAVILQEISMVEETPEEKIHEDFWAAAWNDPGLSHPITGTPESVGAVTAEALAAWRIAAYHPEAITVVAAGALDHDALAEMAEAAFGSLRKVQTVPAPAAGAYTPPRLAARRDWEQNHVILSYPSVGNISADRFAHTLLATLLGGNMSSRLFQEVREKRGLAYSIYAGVNGLADVGLLEIQAAVDPDRTAELLSVVNAELAAVADGAVAAEELDHTREHLKGLLYLGAESTENRMMRLARNILLFNRHIPLEETAACLDAVTPADIARTAKAAFAPGSAGLAVMGPTAALP